jgi:hypothetical protein
MLRKISHIVRRVTHTNSGLRLAEPFTVVRLHGCVHEETSDQPVGAEIECRHCGALEPQTARIREFMASAAYSHVTLRSVAANHDPSWSSYMFYRIDRTSPTQCCLAFSASACDEIEAVIRECDGCAIPGPSRGAIAEGRAFAR